MFKRRVVVAAQALFLQYGALSSLAAEAKQQHRWRARRVTKRIALRNICEEDVTHIVSVPALIVLVIACASGPRILEATGWQMPPVWLRLAMGPVYGGLTLAILWAAGAPAAAFGRWGREQAGAIWTIACGLSSAGIFLAMTKEARGAHVLAFFVAAACASASMTIAFFGAASIAIALISGVFTWVWRQHSCPSIATWALLMTLRRIEDFNDRSVKGTWARNAMLHELESAALHTEATIRRRFAWEDERSKEWAATQASGVGRKIRAEKRIVALGSPSEFPAARERIAAYLLAALNGNWGSLIEASGGPELTPAVPKATRIRRVVEAVVVAAIVPAALWLLWGKLAIEEPAADYLKIGAVAWAAIAIAIGWDPEFASHLIAVPRLGRVIGRE